MRRVDSGSWYFTPDHGQLCQVIETQTLWGETICRVWLPGRDSVVRVPVSRLVSLEDSGTGTADGIVYAASAARVADALTQDVLLAPIESSVIPLPHQIKALSRAITAEGKPLFKPRKTELAPVSWGETHRDQQLLYEAVTEYVREGYNQAMREKGSYIGASACRRSATID